MGVYGAGETKRDPMATFYRPGYYNFAVDRRPDAHEFWIGVYSEPALLGLEGIELVIGDIPTDRQSNGHRRYCNNYAQAAKAMFVERERVAWGSSRQQRRARTGPRR